jgi:predicted DNA-binding transcriptional regulator AlpA
MSDTGEKYQKDPAFRDKFRDMMRRKYREEHPEKLRDCSKTNPLDFGMTRDLCTPVAGVTSRKMSLSTAEIAQAMGYHTVVLYGWMAKGFFPRPPHKVVGSKTTVFSLPQAKAILKVMGEHQKKCQFLREQDREVIERLNEAATK